MPNVMAAQPNTGGAHCECSVIPFLVPCRKVWLMPAAGVPCFNAANIKRTQDAKLILHVAKLHQGQERQKCIYIVCQPRRRSNIVQSFIDFR